MRGPCSREVVRQGRSTPRTTALPSDAQVPPRRPPPTQRGRRPEGAPLGSPLPRRARRGAGPPRPPATSWWAPRSSRADPMEAGSSHGTEAPALPAPRPPRRGATPPEPATPRTLRATRRRARRRRHLPWPGGPSLEVRLASSLEIDARERGHRARGREETPQGGPLDRVGAHRGHDLHRRFRGLASDPLEEADDGGIRRVHLVEEQERRAGPGRRAKLREPLVRGGRGRRRPPGPPGSRPLRAIARSGSSPYRDHRTGTRRADPRRGRAKSAQILARLAWRSTGGPDRRRADRVTGVSAVCRVPHASSSRASASVAVAGRRLGSGASRSASQPASPEG